ncbi:MAG: glycosyltransferase family 2 protein [Sphingobacteriaceae bacterium]|nr:MAG: glycosyltransferase family 2 protein [Sphingobacteriaceae bacterium]
MLPLVSVLIPLYNSQDYILETLNSVKNQTYKNIEIIVVDDGSNDNSYEVAKSFDFENFYIVKQLNEGASAARNHALALAKGTYIQYLDADDVLDYNKIESQLNIIKRFKPTDIICCQWKYFNTSVSQSYKLMPFTTEKTTCYDKIQWLKDRPYMIPHTWLLPRVLIDDIGPWDESLSLNDDGEYFYRMIAASTGVILQNQALAFYRAGNPNSLSTKRTKNAMLSWIKSIRSYKKVMLSVTGEDAKEAVDKALFEVLYHCLNIFPDLVAECKAEMYHPEVNHFKHDKIVYSLSKYIGLNEAKIVREKLNYIRNTTMVNTLFNFIKKITGRETY